MLKKIINWFTRDSLDDAFEAENNFINTNKDKAEQHLRALGWNIICTDLRIAFYSYKIQKGESIHWVSIREAMEMK